MISNVIRIVVILLALGVLFIMPLWVEGPSGRSIVPEGLAADLIAAAAIVVSAWTWWRGRVRA